MLKQTPPTSNTERQRQFRKRNPGYYGRLHRKRNAEIMALALAKAEAKVTQKQQLMLPAPAVLMEVPGMTVPLRKEAAVEQVELR